ncbi:MAG: hypothetical protein ACT4PV_14540 [Planctomycetaceae bacterium]
MDSRVTALLLAAALFPACARTTLKGSAADAAADPRPATELDFWDAVAEQKAVSNHDALRALLLLAEKGAAARDFQGCLAIARERGWIGADASLVANETAEAGWIARAVCLELGIKGGLTMRLAGAHPRYALKELIHMGMMPPKTRRQSISGLELIALMSRAEDYQKGAGTAPRGDI